MSWGPEASWWTRQRTRCNLHDHQLSRWALPLLRHGGGNRLRGGRYDPLLGTLLGGADSTNDAILTVIGAAGIGATAADDSHRCQRYDHGHSCRECDCRCFCCESCCGYHSVHNGHDEGHAQDGRCNASATYTTRAATASSFASVAISNELVVGLVPTFLTFVFTPVTALVAATGSAGGTNEFADTITISSTSAVFVAGKVPTCTVRRDVTALAQSANRSQAHGDERHCRQYGDNDQVRRDDVLRGPYEYWRNSGGLVSEQGRSLHDHQLSRWALPLLRHDGGNRLRGGRYDHGVWALCSEVLTPANDAVLTVIGAAGIGATAAEAVCTPPANVMIMGTPVASATAGAFAVNPAAGTIPFTMVTTKDTLKYGSCKRALPTQLAQQQHRPSHLWPSRTNSS